MRSVIESELSRKLDAGLVSELLTAHAEAKRNFYLGGIRLSEVEGGRFCEAAFRLLEQVATGKFPPLGATIDSDATIRRLAHLPRGGQPDSIRLHIPRALRVVYDIRNNRDVAHLADGIDANLQDATLVVSILDWVVAEFIRLFHTVSADQAQLIVQDLVTRATVIQDFDGFLKVLNPELPASDYCLVLLYHRGAAGAELEELTQWIRPSMRANLNRTLQRLVHEKGAVHAAGTHFVITRRGQLDVERRHLLSLEASI